MRTNLKVILAATAIAALASPVMAQSESHPHAAPSARIVNAHGQAGRAYIGQATESQVRVNSDCAHRQFPQCSESDSAR
jgi:hypothetical protein